MFFSILIIVMVLLVAFFHYIQNFFSATLSAIFAIIAAAVAIGLHENVVAWFKPGKIADSGTAVILCCMFAVTYVVLRLIFDRLVPGNIRLQSTIDKVGAGAMGLVAGIFTAGVFAIAAQTMPFGPSILGWSRYALTDRTGINFQSDPGRSAITRDITDEMKSERYKAEDQNNLMFPVDNIVLSTVSTLSEGSLAGLRPLAAVHQDYLQESFGPRVGMQPGAKHTATTFEGQSAQISVPKVFIKESVRQVEDAELPELRGRKDYKKPESGPEARVMQKDLKPLKPDGSAAANGVLVIVRVQVDKNATDENGSLFRFSTGSVRLVTHDKETGKAHDYYALGTMDNFQGGTLWPNHISDPLFIDNGKADGVDLLFSVEDRAELLENAATPKKGGAAPAAPSGGTIREGTFIEVKRLARVDLGGMPAETNWTADPKFEVMRKQRLKPPPTEQQPQ
jgi:hypothetical protein